MEIAMAKGMEDQIIYDEDGNLANREELIEALVGSSAASEALINEFKNTSDSFVLYFAYDDTEIDEAATRIC